MPLVHEVSLVEAWIALNCRALRRFPKAVQPGLNVICVEIFITSAVKPLHAADKNDRPGTHVLPGRKTGDARVRLVSKNKPRFDPQNRIPSVTPDRSGWTKVKVIVKPSAPLTKRVGAVRASEVKVPRLTRRSPYESSERLSRSRDRLSGRPVALSSLSHRRLMWLKANHQRLTG